MCKWISIFLLPCSLIIWCPWTKQTNFSSILKAINNMYSITNFQLVLCSSDNCTPVDWYWLIGKFLIPMLKCMMLGNCISNNGFPWCSMIGSNSSSCNYPGKFQRGLIRLKHLVFSNDASLLSIKKIEVKWTQIPIETLVYWTSFLHLAHDVFYWFYKQLMACPLIKKV